VERRKVKGRRCNRGSVRVRAGGCVGDQIAEGRLHKDRAEMDGWPNGFVVHRR
jgi:hypothetical protein